MTGKALAKSRGGDRHCSRIEAHADFIKDLLTEQGNNILFEIQDAVERARCSGQHHHRHHAHHISHVSGARIAIHDDRYLWLRQTVPALANAGGDLETSPARDISTGGWHHQRSIH